MKSKFKITAGTPVRFSGLNSWVLLLAVFSIIAISGCESPEERVQQHVAAAEQFFDAENLVKAELEAKNAVQIEPKNADARYILARIAGAKRDFNDMAANLRVAIDSRPDFFAARAKLGNLYSQAGAFDLAEEQLTEMEKLDADNAETHILRARLLANNMGDLEAAAKELKAAIKADPDSLVAVGLFASLTSISDADEAVRIVDEAIARTDDDKGLRQLKLNILNKAGKVDEAEAEYRSLIEDYPDEPGYRYSLAKFLADQGRIDDIYDVLLGLVESDPSNQEAKISLVRFVTATKGLEEGYALLKGFLEEDPDASQLRMLLADQYLSDKGRAIAKAEYQKIVDSHGNEDIALLAKARIASIEIADGRIDSGKSLIDEILTVDSLNANAHFLNGLLNFTSGNWKEAVSELRSTLREDPTNVRAKWLLARTHVNAGDAELAEDSYRRLLKQTPLNVAATLELTRLLVDEKELDKAVELLSEQIAIIPNDVDLSKALIAILVERKRFDDALAEAGRIGATPDNSALGQYFSGAIYQARGQHNLAAESFKRALNEKPDAREPLQGLAVSLMAQDKADEAKQYFQDLSEKFPENLFIKTLLGQILAGTGETGEAREIFESALSEKSDWLPAYAALAGLDSADPEAQISVFQRGLEAAPGNQQMALLLGSAYEKSGEIEKAIKTYEDALAENPDMPLVANNLAALLADYRQDEPSFQKALEYARQFETSEQPVLLDTIGWVYYRLGEFDKAQRLLEKAVNGEVNAPVLQYHLGMIYLAQNREQLAIQQLRAATEVAEIDYPGKDIAEKTLAELLGAD